MGIFNNSDHSSYVQYIDCVKYNTYIYMYTYKCLEIKTYIFFDKPQSNQILWKCIKKKQLYFYQHIKLFLKSEIPEIILSV